MENHIEEEENDKPDEEIQLDIPMETTKAGDIDTSKMSEEEEMDEKDSPTQMDIENQKEKEEE